MQSFLHIFLFLSRFSYRECERDYQFGDVIDQGDYRYIYIGCEDFEEYRLGCLKRLIHRTPGSTICTTEDEVFDVLAQSYLGCTWAEAQAQGYTKEQIYQLGGVTENEYLYEQELGLIADGWEPFVVDTTKTAYESIPAKVDGVPVVSLCNTFMDCTALTETPDLSKAVYVTNMSGTFIDCTSLTKAPAIPNNVMDMRSAFYGCTSLTDVSELVVPNSVIYMLSTFYNCTSLTGSITINATPDVYDDCLLNTQITEILGDCGNKADILATK